ncbi:hypothetical protein SAMN06272759_1134 [Novosphingobium sp. B1]|nr:hypothetical protein SAMN06272759_1134 [Novosphingobium sp. B1]
MLTGFFVVKGLKDVAISNVERMSSGASKEQFAFTLNHSAGSHPDRLVLRMDPLEAIAQTCRGRDGEIQRIMGYHMPVAPVRWFDADGDLLGQPAAIPEFVREVTRPSQGRAAGLSGMGGRMGNLIDRLAPQYIDALAKLPGSTGHARIRATSMRHTPTVTRRRSAGQLVVAGLGGLPGRAGAGGALAERWLREHAPVCDRRCWCIAICAWVISCSRNPAASSPRFWIRSWPISVMSTKILPGPCRSYLAHGAICPASRS